MGVSSKQMYLLRFDASKILKASKNEPHNIKSTCTIGEINLGSFDDIKNLKNPLLTAEDFCFVFLRSLPTIPSIFGTNVLI